MSKRGGWFEKRIRKNVAGYVYFQMVVVNQDFEMRDTQGRDNYWRGYLMVEGEDIP